MLIHVQLRLPAARAQTKFHIPEAYLMNWHNSNFVYKLKTIEAENP